MFTYLHPVVRSKKRHMTSLTSAHVDEQEFEALYAQYFDLLAQIAAFKFQIPDTEAETLVHDVLLGYLKKSATIVELRPWLIGAIGNASANYLRKRKREAELLPEHEEAPDAAAEESLDGWMRRLTIAAVLARLGTKCRETLRLYYLHEEPKERIAAHLATSPAYVLQLLVTCRRRAQELLRSLSRVKE